MASFRLISVLQFSVSHFARVIWLVGAASVLETLAEPAYLVIQNRMLAGLVNFYLHLPTMSTEYEA